MALLAIAIDTANNQRYSCVVSGNMRDLDALHKAVDKVLVSHNQKGPFHWRRLRRKVRISAQKDVYKLINDAELHFNIFDHTPPANVSSKDFYLKHIPNVISGSLDIWLEGKGGTIKIDVDEDYKVKGVEDSTGLFVQNLIRRLCERLVGTITIRRNKDFLATIKQFNGKFLNFIGSVSDRNLSKGIQLADLVLGYYLYDKAGIEKKVYFKKI